MTPEHLAKTHLAEDRKMIGFMVGDVLYGIDIMRIREIINPIAVVDMPSSPSYVIGVADHRETVVPIIDIDQGHGFGL